MKAYEIKITPIKGAPVVFSSFVNGGTDVNDLCALHVDLDLPIASFDISKGKSMVVIYGVTSQMVADADLWNGALIEIKGGFSKGFPLGNWQKYGLLVRGTIYFAYGNHIDLIQNLNICVIGEIGNYAEPSNFVLNWLKGEPLAPALQKCLEGGLPAGTKVDINCSPKLVLPDTQVGRYATLSNLSAAVNAVTSQIVIKNGYSGLKIVRTGAGYFCFDNVAYQPPVTKIEAIEIFGAPSWGAGSVFSNTVSVQVTVGMRSGISVGDLLSFPETPVRVTDNSAAMIVRSKLLTGKYRVQKIRHSGKMGGNTALNWCTIIDVVKEFD
jgi:hypothetical protein